MPKSLLVHYLFFFWAFVQFPLACVVKIDPGAKTCGLACVSYYIYLFLSNKDFRWVAKSFFSVIWLILICYHIWNSVDLKVKFEMGHSLLFFKAFLCYFVMVLSAFLFKIDAKRAFSVCVVSFYLYMFCSLSVMSVDESFGGRIKGGIHPNQLAQCAGMFMMLMACRKNMFGISMKKILQICIIPFIIMLYCGSRNGLLLLVFFILTLCVSSLLTKGLSTKKLFLFLCGSLFAIAFTYFVMSHTMVGERMLATKSQAESVQLKSGTILDYLGDRGWYYIVGWDMFLQSPVRGIGYYNFRNFNVHDLPLHSEYMMNICEGGIIAVVLYFSFLLRMLFTRIKSFRKQKTPLSFSLLMSLLAYMAIGLTAREFIYSPFYPVLGLILYSNISEKNERKSIRCYK